MADKNWWHGHKWATMIRDLQTKGVEIIYYRDRHRPHDDTLPVYERKAFSEAIGVPLGVPDVPSNTYIEIADAYTIYKEIESGTFHFHTQQDGQAVFSFHGTRKC